MAVEVERRRSLRPPHRFTFFHEGIEYRCLVGQYMPPLDSEEWIELDLYKLLP